MPGFYTPIAASLSGTSALTDNTDPASLIEIALPDGKDLLEFDTTDNAVKLNMLAGFTASTNESSGFVGLRQSTPLAPFHVTGTGGPTGISIDPTTAGSPTMIIENAGGNSKDRCLLILNGDGNSGSSIDLYGRTSGGAYDTRLGGVAAWPGNASFYGQAVTTVLEATGSNVLALKTNGANRIYITGDGKISIGNPSDTTPLCSAGGIHLYDSDTGGSASIYGDNLVVESTTHPGIQILGANTSRNTIAFGDAQDNLAGEMRFTHGGGSNLNMWFFRMHSATAMCLDHDHKLGVNHEPADASAAITIKGNLTTNLSDSTSVISDGATGTNRYVASTAHGLAVGSAVKIDGATYTVATVTDADNFILDSDHGSTGDKGQATTDPDLFQLKTGDDSAVVTVDHNGRFGDLHIYSGTGSSLASPSGAADDFVIEGSANPGMTILSGGNNQLGSIFFADDASNGHGWVRYQHHGTPASGSMAVKSAGHTFFETGGEVERMRITSTGRVGINESDPDLKFSIKASSTHEDVFGIFGNGGAVVLRLEAYDGDSGAVRVIGNGYNQHLILGRDGSNGSVEFNIQKFDCDFNYSSQNITNMLHIDASADKIGINTNAPAATLDVKGTLNEALTGHLDSSSSGTNLVGDGTDFKNELTWGSAIKITTSGGTETFTVASITSDTVLTLDSAISGSPTDGTTMYTDPPAFHFKTGDDKDLFKVIGTQQFHLGADDDSGLKVGNSIFPNDDNAQSENTGFGVKCGSVTTGQANVLFGQSVMSSATGASNGNVCFGRMIGSITAATSSYNVMMGSGAGNYLGGADHNVAIGTSAGNAITTGDNNVSIGSDSDCAATASNQIAIGYQATATIANEAVIGNASVAAIRPMSAGQCLIGRSGFEVSGMVGYGGGVLMGRAAAVSSINQDGKILAQVFASSASPLTIPANSYVVRMGITSTSNADSNAYSVTLNTGTATGESALGALTGSVERIGAGEADSRTSASTGSAADLAVAATSSHTKVTGITTDGFWTGANDLYVYVMTAGTGNANTGSGLNFKFGVYVEYIGMD